MALAVQFLYFETVRVANWRKTKDKGGSGYEASTCFMARDVVQKIRRAREHFVISVACTSK